MRERGMWPWNSAALRAIQTTTESWRGTSADGEERPALSVASGEVAFQVFEVMKCGALGDFIRGDVWLGW
jgi:hypothetical protein